MSNNLIEDVVQYLHYNIKIFTTDKRIIEEVTIYNYSEEEMKLYCKELMSKYQDCEIVVKEV